MKSELIQDAVERLACVEIKLDDYEVLREKTENARERADYTFSIIRNNEEDIEKVKEDQKWPWRAVADIGVSIIVYLLTKYSGGVQE